MKKLISLIIISASFLSCNQKGKVKQENSINNPLAMRDITKYISSEAKNITENNFVDKLNQQIKHYDKEPVYYLRINKQNCVVRIYLNDVNIYDDYELSNVITPTEITNILSSGNQEVKIKMFPVDNLINEDLGLENEAPATKLSSKANVEIEIFKMDNKSAKDFSNEQLIVKKSNPSEAAGKEFFEFTVPFIADVPYTFEGWKKGQDLRKLDQDLVQKKAVEFYALVGDLFLNKEVDNWLKLKYPLTIRTMSSSYVDKIYLQDLLQEYKNDVNGYDYKVEKIKDYDIEYMGGGKLIRLITRNQHPKLRGGGALLLKYGEKGIYQPGITLYLPEGRDLATQGFMMWK